ncbi:MAG: C10 family peptidase, partial [Bacteroidaceae bacterium]|nr:C10 family peptidase [Bacteroidaceae bacterium]
VMKYYEHPETGKPVTYGSETRGRINNQTYVAPEVNLGMTYRWDKMRNKYEKNGYTSDEGVAVAELMYAVGRACKMQYGTQASSAYTSDLASALGNYFKYDKSLEYAVRSYYSDEEWEDKIYNCLSLFRPVIYGAMADDDSGGHCFIIDGYDSSEEKYHVNWGWGGYCDGLFVITGTRSLLPTGSGSGGANEDAAYSVGHEAIVNLFTDEGGESVVRMYSDRYVLCGQNGLSVNSIEAGNYIYLVSVIKNDAVVCNLSNNAVNSEIGVKFRNTGSGMVEYVSAIDANHKLAVYSGYSSISVRVPFSLAGGTYELTVVYKDNSGNWVEAKKCPSQEPCILTVCTRNDKILPTMPLRLPSENTLQKDNHEIVYSLRNTTNGALSGVRARLYVLPPGSKDPLFYYEKVLDFAAGEEKRLTYTPDDISEEDRNSANYYAEGQNYVMIPLCILPGQFQYQYEQISLSCGATDTVKYVLDEDWSTICLPFDADVPEGMYAYSLTRTPDGEIEATPAGGKINMNVPYLVAGTKNTYTFVGPKTYSLELCGGGILRGSTWENGAKVPRYGFMLQKVGNEYKFVRVDTYDKMITQYHAYVALDDALAHGELSIPLSATAVETVAGERMQPVGEADAFYNVSGQRVDEASKGIVVSRGKKVLRK